ncbi:MAG TPA: hypothetical protein PLA90_12560 [Candidatus Sumerlaeota bacterium]|nr:hypothetical protein [Candidatus Sumerlaeota bacterium]HPS02361.1 hypothetical protein [Candidatus Sumerlaeota bacterium]
MDPVFPVFIYEKDCGEVSMWGTHEAMLEYFEPIDMEEHEYLAWDSTGIPLDLLLGEQPIWLLFEKLPEPDRVVPSLSDALTRYASSLGITLSPEDLGNPGRAYGLLMETLKKKTKSMGFWRRLWGRF